MRKLRYAAIVQKLNNTGVVRHWTSMSRNFSAITVVI